MFNLFHLQYNPPCSVTLDLPVPSEYEVEVKKESKLEVTLQKDVLPPPLFRTYNYDYFSCSEGEVSCVSTDPSTCVYLPNTEDNLSDTYDQTGNEKCKTKDVESGFVSNPATCGLGESHSASITPESDFISLDCHSIPAAPPESVSVPIIPPKSQSIPIYCDSIPDAPPESCSIPITSTDSQSIPISSQSRSILYSPLENQSIPFPFSESHSVPISPDWLSLDDSSILKAPQEYHSIANASDSSDVCKNDKMAPLVFDEAITSCQTVSANVPAPIQVDHAICAAPTISSNRDDSERLEMFAHEKENMNYGGTKEFNESENVSQSGKEDSAEVTKMTSTEQGELFLAEVIKAGGGDDSSSLSDSDWLNEKILPKR